MVEPVPVEEDISDVLESNFVAALDLFESGDNSTEAEDDAIPSSEEETVGEETATREESKVGVCI